MNGTTRYSLDNYFAETPSPVFQLTATAQFSSIDIDIVYLTQAGWNQTVDRLRLHRIADKSGSLWSKSTK